MNLRRLAKRRVALTLVVAALSLLALDSACFEPPTLDFNLDLPASISSRATWIEIGAFGQGVCPTPRQLAGGVSQAGAVARIVFPVGDTNPPAFGDLPKETYGFAAVARSADCAVIGEGCTVVDVDSANDISIQLSPVSSPAGACEPGNACMDAVCVAQSSGGGGAGGSGCSLAFVGGGPLGDPLGLDSTLLSPPAIVATSEGFLIAYREFDPDEGTARITLIPVDDDGGSSGAVPLFLKSRCMGSPESDATGLAWSGSSGVVAVSRQACTSTGPGVDVYAVDVLGNTSQGAFSATPDNVVLSQGHALAYTPSGLLIATLDAVTEVPTVTVVEGTSLTSTFPFGDVTATGAFVTGTMLGTGLLALGTPAADPDAASDPPPSADGGEPFYTASFASLSGGPSLSKLPAPHDFPGTWVSLGGVDSRVLVATNGAKASSPIVWYAFDVGVAAPIVVDGFAPAAPGEVVYTDVALYADNAFFAAEVGDSVSLFAFRKASTYPELVVENDFFKDTRIPIGNVHDGLVAVAADATRVAVVWGTGKTVSNLQDLGGYAVFACVP